MQGDRQWAENAVLMAQEAPWTLSSPYFRTQLSDWTPDKMGALIEGAMRAAQRIGFDPRRPITLVGVAALGSPDYLIEVEAIAVLA